MNSKDQGVVSTLIMFVIVILLVFVIAGCSTVVPVMAKFPDAPGRQSTTACPDLQKLTETAKLSDVARTVTVNYSTYYECAVKLDAWIEWYSIQKEIFKGAGK